MGTKNNPGKYDCYANAEPDEPMFILLGRDPAAPSAIFAWSGARRELIQLGAKPVTDLRMIQEAEDCAHAMIAWRKANRKPTP